MTHSTRPTLTVSQEFVNPKELFRSLSTFPEQLRTFFSSQEETQYVIGANQVPNPRTLSTKLRKASYADLRTIPVQVPAGLVSTYSAYLKTLDEAVTVTQGLMDDVLGPFSRWLAIGLSDPDSLNNLGGGRRIDDFKPHNIDGVTNNLGKHFETGKNHHERQFGQVFERNADVEGVFKDANDIAGRFIKTDRQKVRTKTDEIAQLLDTLIQRINEDEENYKTSKVTREMVAKMTYTLAQEVEFYAVVGYQLTALAVALKETEERILKVV